jgi:zinc protease
MKKFAVLAMAWTLGSLTAQAPVQAPVAVPGTPAPQPAAPKPAPAPVPKVEFEKYTLPNGLEVILHVDRKLPMVHVNEWYHVGSNNERPGKTGFAHLFEHMMFEGSKNGNQKYLALIEKAGANLAEGGVNGTTDWDRTNYFATLPAGNLEYLLWLESDRLATLPDALTREKLDNQRDVVKNERRQGLENQPYGRSTKLMFENLYPNRHPYANDVIGSHEDLTAASVEDVKEFFKTYYTPNNLSLTVAGDFDVAATKRLIEKYFGGIPAGPALDRSPRWVPQLDGEKIVEVRDRVAQERVYFAWHTPAFFDPGDAELDLVQLILGDGLSSRLNKALVYDKQLCSDVTAYQASRELASNFVIYATARPGVSLAEIERVVTAEVGRLALNGPTLSELNRAKVKWEYQFVTGLERIGGFGGKADRLNQYNVFLGNPDRFDADVKRHRNASWAGVRDAAKKFLDTHNRLLIRFHPETSGRESSVALNRAEQPAFGADRPFQAPEVQTAQLPNGMDLFVVERKDLPKVAVLLATRAGSVADPPGKEGLADLTMVTIKLGTKTRKALEIEDALGDLGTSINGFGGRERSGLSFDVLKRNLAPAMAIFADVVRNPVFPASEVDREKKTRLDALAQEAQDPDAIAFRVSAMLVFGAEHPYGRPQRGLPGTVQALTSEDFASYHATYWKPASTALIISGDISLAEAIELGRRYFGTWAGGAAPAVDISEPHPMGTGKIYLVDRQDAAQTEIMQILPGPPRKTSDYYALRLADTVWGGAGGARLSLNLREEKGYSYGVFSFPGFYKHAGMWRAGGGVQTNRTKESVFEFVKELKFLAGEKPISETELANAKANRVRGYAQQFEALSRIGDQIAELWGAGLPMTDLQRAAAEFEKTLLAAVNAAARKYAQPAGASLLLVGDVAKIEAGIRELNAGEIVKLDTNGRPLR